MTNELYIYDTLTRQKRKFESIQPQHVNMYVCGMTVYDYCHVGHARVMVVFDMIQRWFKSLGYSVNYVRNITDIDDKIIKRAQENNEPIAALTSRFIQAMYEDADALGIERPTHEPKATESVAEMLDLIQTLMDKGLAYKAGNGDVNYSVRKFTGYGKLSGKSLDDLRAGERVAVATDKQDPLDFVLWKHAKPEEPSDAKWFSPWGEGRPGWHIECSAMSKKMFGQQFDIHGGGADLQFPHHENEIAQSEGAHECAYVNYWMHNGFIRVDDEKMSKSLGNFFTIRDVLKTIAPEVLRFFILRAQYRSPLNYSDAHLQDAKQSLDRLYLTLRNVEPDNETLSQAIDWQQPFAARFKNAMNDDFATPEAVAVLFELATDVNKLQSAQLAALLKQLGGVLGILQQNAAEFLKAQVQGDTDAHDIDAKVLARNQAKKDKNFALADQIRAELLAQGVVLEDAPGGVTTWRRA